MSTANEEFVRLFRATGWTQTELASRLRIKQPSVSAMINGGNVHPSRLLQLRLILASVMPEALNDDDRAELRQVDQPTLRDDVVQYGEKLASLPEEKRRIVTDMIDALSAADNRQPINYRKLAAAERQILEEGVAEIERARAKLRPEPPTSSRAGGTPPASDVAPTSAGRKKHKGNFLGDT